MDLQEIRKRISEEVTPDQLETLQPLYILLDVHKDVFCKFVVGAGGVERVCERMKGYYGEIIRAVEEKRARDNYKRSVARLQEIAEEAAALSEERGRINQMLDRNKDLIIDEFRFERATKVGAA
jgi:hypothetical protein